MTLQEPAQRLLALEGSYNIRDIGGYATQDGKHTRWRTVLRSDSLHSLTPASQKSLLDYGVRTIVDLRRPSELAKKQNVLSRSPAVSYLHLPLFGDEQGAVIFAVETLLGQYCLLFDLCQQEIKAIMQAIATCTPPLLVHCAVGKDRTGVIIALLLGVANVPADTIAADYALSADYLAPLFALELEKATLAGSAYLFESKPDTMLETLNYLDRQYGGVVGYLRTIGMTNEQLSHLHAMLVN